VGSEEGVGCLGLRVKGVRAHSTQGVSHQGDSSSAHLLEG
jgi:hypothetical protein